VETRKSPLLSGWAGLVPTLMPYWTNKTDHRLDWAGQGLSMVQWRRDGGALYKRSLREMRFINYSLSKSTPRRRLKLLLTGCVGLNPIGERVLLKPLFSFLGIPNKEFSEKYSGYGPCYRFAHSLTSGGACGKLNLSKLRLFFSLPLYSRDQCSNREPRVNGDSYIRNEIS